MKLWQALRAMDRGDIVKLRGSEVWCRHGETFPECSTDKGKAWGTCVMPCAWDGWVIVRKKKKALRDVWKSPRVGDVVQRHPTCTPEAVQFVEWDEIETKSEGGVTYRYSRSEWAYYAFFRESKVVSRVEDSHKPSNVL